MAANTQLRFVNDIVQSSITPLTLTHMITAGRNGIQTLIRL